jgi:1,2-diacylglycerol 3-alpha-glucosyltransferase
MTRLALCFTNFGPYHLARLRALAVALGRSGGRLFAYEVAGTERMYPWQPARGDEPFTWKTLFPDRALEEIPGGSCSGAIREALESDRPDAVAICGYARPESMAALGWARSSRKPVILMSESQAIDHRRVWWKEAIKRRRVCRCDAALVGGPRHRDYLVSLGMPRERVVLGYNAVDNDYYAREAEQARRDPAARHGLPAAPYFLAVNRFVPEKNLTRLIRAFAHYRASARDDRAWELVLCGDGPASAEVETAIADSGFANAIHRPGFLQVDALPRWYAFASAFVHPSLLEPWGLVVNEAAACGLPLLVSDRAGCAETLGPGGAETTGRRFDPRDVEGLAAALGWMAGLPEAERSRLGARSRDVVSRWGPERFASGMLEALTLAQTVTPDGPKANALATASR